MQAFKNLFVLDLSQGIAGPVCGGILARQGARVVKVEPLTGDWIRATGGSREGMCANAAAGGVPKRIGNYVPDNNWVKKLETADVLVSPINDYLALRDDEQAHDAHPAPPDAPGAHDRALPAGRAD